MKLFKSRRGLISYISRDEALYMIQTLADKLRQDTHCGPVVTLTVENEEHKTVTIEVVDSCKDVKKKSTKKKKPEESSGGSNET